MSDPDAALDPLVLMRASPEWLRLREALLVAEEDAWLEAALVAKGEGAPPWLREAVEARQAVRGAGHGDAHE